MRLIPRNWQRREWGRIELKKISITNLKKIHFCIKVMVAFDTHYGKFHNMNYLQCYHLKKTFERTFGFALCKP